MNVDAKTEPEFLRKVEDTTKKQRAQMRLSFAERESLWQMMRIPKYKTLPKWSRNLIKKIRQYKNSRQEREDPRFQDQGVFDISFHKAVDKLMIEWLHQLQLYYDSSDGNPANE